MAYLIDFTLLIIASAILHPVFNLQAVDANQYFWQLILLYVVLGLVYAPVMESSYNQGTIGKMLMGIAVSDRQGKKIKLRRAYCRHLCKLLSYLTFLIGFFLAGFNQEKQALHDLIVDTFVIRRT